MTTNKKIKQQGAVSLFVVIFAALLMTIVTVGFVQLMIKDQQQATTSDLSQSAYDSSLAGVEDAKRLLILDQSCRDGTAGPGVDCNKVTAALTPSGASGETECDTLAASGVVGETNGETIIQKTTGDDASKQLDQAYTCVKITTNTDNYKAQLAVNQSSVIPLRGVSEFDTVTISWFSKDDLPNPNDTTLTYGTALEGTSLPPVGDKWKFNRPSLMRAQLMQTGASFTQADFNDGQNSGSDNNTLFLFPATAGANSLPFAATDPRRSPTNAPHVVRCEPDLRTSDYACQMTLTLPAPNDGNTVNRNAYLHLGALYNGAHYKVELKKANVPVKFDRVQPIVDSTGRANDAFRRVQARVELKSDFTYPEAAIDIAGDLCKNFTITDNNAGYSSSPTCTP
jgi:hypothetical protein